MTSKTTLAAIDNEITRIEESSILITTLGHDMAEKVGQYLRSVKNSDPFGDYFVLKTYSDSQQIFCENLKDAKVKNSILHLGKIKYIIDWPSTLFDEGLQAVILKADLTDHGSFTRLCFSKNPKVLDAVFSNKQASVVSETMLKPGTLPIFRDHQSFSLGRDYFQKGFISVLVNDAERVVPLFGISVFAGVLWGYTDFECTQSPVVIGSFTRFLGFTEIALTRTMQIEVMLHASGAPQFAILNVAGDNDTVTHFLHSRDKDYHEIYCKKFDKPFSSHPDFSKEMDNFKGAEESGFIKKGIHTLRCTRTFRRGRGFLGVAVSKNSAPDSQISLACETLVNEPQYFREKLLGATICEEFFAEKGTFLSIPGLVAAPIEGVKDLFGNNIKVVAFYKRID